MTFAMLAKVAASVTDLKKDPRGTYRESGGDLDNRWVVLVLDVGRRDDNGACKAAKKRLR